MAEEGGLNWMEERGQRGKGTLTMSCSGEEGNTALQSVISRNLGPRTLMKNRIITAD